MCVPSVDIICKLVVQSVIDGRSLRNFYCCTHVHIEPPEISAITFQYLLLCLLLGCLPVMLAYILTAEA